MTDTGCVFRLAEVEGITEIVEVAVDEGPQGNGLRFHALQNNWAYMELNFILRKLKASEKKRRKKPKEKLKKKFEKKSSEKIEEKKKDPEKKKFDFFSNLFEVFLLKVTQESPVTTTV